jgi:D-beta-D-heptose 7-phosphate kinase/D-beta-D-heptose 1-phosphate adenosyltransferase
MESYLVKIKTLEEAKEACADIRASGGTVVFTNGCFDILHPGHTRYLCAARELGNILIVAVNSDRSVKAIKEPGRPILDEQVRAEMLASLSCVDMVLVFDEDDPLKVIQYLMPDVLVKGGDWPEGQIVGADEVKAAGGKVKRIPVVKGYSSTAIIQKILESYS